jgi:hypothetical protein
MQVAVVVLPAEQVALAVVVRVVLEEAQDKLLVEQTQVAVVEPDMVQV